MRKALAAAALGAAIVVGAPAVNADTPSATPTATQTVTRTETETRNVPVKDNTGLWGLTGLLGLAGLAGLRKPRHEVHGATPVHTTPVRHETTTVRTDTVRHDADAVRRDVNDVKNNDGRI